jgi:transcriptional regulator with PAS, ATPase and Fis domain
MTVDAPQPLESYRHKKPASRNFCEYFKDLERLSAQLHINKKPDAGPFFKLARIHGIQPELSKLFFELGNFFSGSLKTAEDIKVQCNEGSLAADGIYMSPSLKKIYLQIKAIAAVTTTVLITGATGTGKEVIAKLIHENSPRKDKPLIVVDCASIPEKLFESEMFGIKQGIATGVQKRIGHIEQSHGGTLFLDEIAEMSLEQQAKLLRVLESKTVLRIGSSKLKKVDFNLITATNKNLAEEVDQGRFRSDLYYRLNVINVKLPPLVERKEDIAPMAQYFMWSHRRRLNLAPLSFTREALACLELYSWPGNCRELNNEMERLAVLAQSDQVYVSDLSSHIVLSGKSPITHRFQDGLPEAGTVESICGDIPLELEQAERILVLKSLEKARNNKSKAARLLGISREGLRKKIKRLGLSAGNHANQRACEQN